MEYFKRLLHYLIQEVLLSRIFYSFPVQLLLLNIRKNILIMIIWITLLAIVTQSIGTMIGLPYLFLEPEYMDRVNFWSTFIIGLTLGGLMMSYHITCYILDGHRFSFLGNLRHPFTKFCINNSFVPLLFLGVYIRRFFTYQDIDSLEGQEDILIRIAGLLAGILVIVSFFSIYFLLTNKDAFRIVSARLNRSLRRTVVSKVNIIARYENTRKNKIRVDYYLNDFFVPRHVESVPPIDRGTILKVFVQNHLNSIIIQSTIFFLILLLGTYRDNPYFQIPAGASVLLLLTIVVMFTGAISFWLRGWAVFALIIGVFLVNTLAKQQLFQLTFQAYGLNYNVPRAQYSLRSVRELTKDSIFLDDVKTTTIALNNWRAKFPKDKKPKMVFICTSGGGHRACVWTMRTLQHVDSTLAGRLMEHTQLITGASGGMVGAAYYRELLLRKQQGENINIYAPQYLDNIARDHLNSIAFNWIVNDIFFRYQEFRYKGLSHRKDRGYAFEQQLNKNTGGILDKPLCDYKEPELQALIPMMILSPTIVNDGRKLYVSPQHTSYMNVPSIFQTRFLNQKVKGVEFLRFFKEQEAENLRFLTALRMSATFPYVTPNIKLPSQPTMEIMDAGLNDNFGVSVAVRFIFVFKKWIQENTSGVVIVSIRDTQKDRPIAKNIEPSLFQRIFTPLETIYVNQEYFQDMHNDDLVEMAQSWFSKDVKVHRVEFQYVPISKSLQEIQDKRDGKIEIDPNRIILTDRAALSWHLTKKEKESLVRTIYETRNQTALRQLDLLLRE